jgi:hypothetical protein
LRQMITAEGRGVGLSEWKAAWTSERLRGWPGMG